MISMELGGKLTGKLMLVNELCDVAMLQSLLLFTRGCSFSRIAMPHSHFTPLCLIM